MKPFWTSLREYVVTVTRAWWQLAIGFLAAAFAVVTEFKAGLLVPTWVGVVVAIVALITAQFLAFHRVRLARDQAGTQLVPAPWLVNEFSGGSYWPHHLAGHVDMSGHGLAVRVIVGPRDHDLDVRIGKQLRELLKTSLEESPFESWLRARTSEASWSLKMPMGPFVANVERDQLSDRSKGATYSAFAFFQLPSGPQSPRAVLAVDLVWAPNPDVQSAARLTLQDIRELCLAMLVTSLDQVAPRLFPMVELPQRRFRRRRHLVPVGPSIFFCTPNGRTLADYIDLSALHLVQGATLANVQQVASIELPSGQWLASHPARETFVRNGLKAILEGSNFVDGDEYVDSLPPPPEAGLAPS
jgi:hypothetical protein